MFGFACTPLTELGDVIYVEDDSLCFEDCCEVDEDCPTNEHRCVDGVCVWCDADGCSPHECEADEECPDGGQCVQGTCEARMGCGTSSDCEGHQTCEGGICVERVPEACSADADCDTGRICIVEHPETQQTGVCGSPLCSHSQECKAGQLCEVGRCVWEWDCKVDQHCPDGHVCQDLHCVPS